MEVVVSKSAMCMLISDYTSKYADMLTIFSIIRGVPYLTKRV